ncbi:iron-sulfur cluster repair di-iron protein [Shewanella schlegeliana]|uniref:Iron-sulfur cluster repair di-iron protein n=1 Tax=Shewanella schlegeliana TaxID=190308 RepID=A0ABS1T3Y3_9GAMM|nr:iron-sulfur cluster repair di-iron protein [Shewanella schlegeliana]MBL4915491.1 iron-sulfur cluster repair di-iron protein [Shewanella schlegeliana]MCL1111804.1 iron-sulfur cluster repair di-iron protein [Shewanella schlegeliana]GIU36593.1 iron-sulfur cluster repair di-iron protein [Shewanella schlegeliana]
MSQSKAPHSKESLLASRVGELVANDFRTAHLFSQHGIDFCCGGGISLERAIKRFDADETSVIDALMALETQGEKLQGLEQLPLPDLLNYIESTHHTFVREKAPLLVEYSQKMVRAHGENHAEIKPLAGWIHALVEDLMPHLMKEERILFPAILGLHNQVEMQNCFGHIGNPINAMQYEHDDALQIFEKISELTNGFVPPAHACTTWRVCYATLAEFEADLKQHIYLENNILFPKALALTA